MASLRRGSHRRITVTCDYRSSAKCRREWSIEERLANETRAKNDGRMICVYCSRATKGTGRGNPNTRYSQLDDVFFEKIDTEAKAYLLGWIASDGGIVPNSISIYVHKKDACTLQVLRDVICPALPIKHKKTNLVGFTINSKQIVTSVCRWLAISPGKKSAVVGFPALETPALSWAFIRGVFDGDGSITSIDAAYRRSNEGWPTPRCSITSGSARLLDGIAAFSKVPAYRGKDQLQWQGTNALDFLGKVYGDATLRLTRKHDLYLDWCLWQPGLNAVSGRRGTHPLFRWSKTLPKAVPPSKEYSSDSGFDLTLVERKSRHGAVEFFRTGIRIQPAFGWYFDLVPRSSISKSGYMLANGVGVIDRAYVGEILVPLIKVDPSAPDLALPARIVQIIPRPIVAVELVEVDELDSTARGAGGFGSTGG